MLQSFNINQTFVTGPRGSNLEILSNRVDSDIVLLSVHGQWSNAATFNKLNISLGNHGIGAMSLSLEGHGASSKIDRLLSLQDAIDDVSSVVRYVSDQGKKIILLGHSSGGGVIQHYLANEYHHNVKGVVLANAVPISGGLLGNLNFIAETGLTGLILNLKEDTSLTRQMAKQVLYNGEEVPLDFCDRDSKSPEIADRLLNLQLLRPMTSEQIQTLKDKGIPFMVVSSSSDLLVPRLSTFDRENMPKIAVDMDFQGNHMAIFNPRNHAQFIDGIRSLI